MSGRIIMILGPTAIGKTALAMAVFDALGGDAQARLVSVDSALVYKGLDIGTAKPTPDELAAYPHALIDVREPADPYTVADFVTDADREIRSAFNSGQDVILVGGTMLYAKRFIEGIAQLPQATPELRDQLKAEYEVDGGELLYRELHAVDPRAATAIHPNNPQRLLRALEVIRMTGTPISELWENQPGDEVTKRLGVAPLVFGLVPQERSALHLRIAARLEKMLAAGFLDEVRGLKSRQDLHLDLPSIRAVGYRQAWLHLDGHSTHEEFVAAAATATRRLAKRQLTWLRQWPQLIPVEIERDIEVGIERNVEGVVRRISDLA